MEKKGEQINLSPVVEIDYQPTTLIHFQKERTKKLTGLMLQAFEQLQAYKNKRKNTKEDSFQYQVN